MSCCNMTAGSAPYLYRNQIDKEEDSERVGLSGNAQKTPIVMEVE